MSRLFPWFLLALAALLCVAGSYGLRFSLMEADHWVGRCVETPQYWVCELRATLGWLIHTGVLAWSGLLVAVLAFVLPGRGGRLLAVPALLLSLPALVLYSASLAVFAVLLALLRLVRAPRPAAQAC
jgi:hypothetical protein